MPQKENTSTGFESSIKWWERKRLMYTIITILGGLLVVFVRSELPNGLSPFSNYAIILFYVFGANIFYTCGWGLEALLNYYFKIPFWGTKTRQTFFVLGTLFSFVWMFLLTRDSI